ncbi:hypothetical protein Q5752_004336 [Cryptotrichosporon argae]
MASTRPTSVRGLYTPPAEEWVFLPPSVSPPAHAPATPTHLPTPFTPAADIDDAVETVYGPLQTFATQYFVTALGMPFEVGKTLLQIEYRPRRRFAPDDELVEAEKKEWDAEDDELSNPEEAEAYFTDRLASSTTSFVPPPAPAPDASGYLPDPSPTWLLKDDPDVSRGNGVWGMIRRVRATPSEGLPALWKSQIVSTIHSILSNVVQPQIHSLVLVLYPTRGVPLDFPLTALPHPAVPLALQVGSHLLAHFLLSPLELLRTRMIALPSSHPSTPSSAALFRRTIEDEGGFFGLYFHPNLVIPTVLEHTIRPLLTLSIPLVLERQFGLSPDLAPITYSLADLGLNIAALLVVLPIETVRRRLQVQTRPPAGKRIKSVVRLRDRDYVGVVEAMWRIVTEETAVPRKRQMTEKDEGGLMAGVRQLYRGFGMAVSAHVTVFGLGLVSAGLGGRGLDAGWKEI